MDDKFLYQNRPPLRAGFGENLYARLSNPTLQKGMSSNFLRFILRFVLTALLLFAVLFAFSQPVRAGVLNWIKQIAGLEVEETNTFPVAEGETVSVPPEARYSLKDIIKDLPYELVMPAHVPDGFFFEDKVDVQDKSVFMRWLNGNGNEILMLVDTDHGQRYITGTDAAQEIQVNGQPALLVQGGYDVNGNWDSNRWMMNIIQRRDDVIYWLIYIQNSDGEFDGTAVKDELIQMMGSIR